MEILLQSGANSVDKYVMSVCRGLFFTLVMALAAFAQEPSKPADGVTTKPAQNIPIKPADTTASKAAETKAPRPAEEKGTPPSTAAKTVSPAEAMRQSIEKQREAVKKQAELAGAWLKIGDFPPLAAARQADGPAIETNCDPLGDEVIAPLIESNAKSQQLTPELLRAVMEQESGYRPCAVSRKGAQGLMQLMPTTAQDFGVTDIFDPKQNVAAGTKLLKQLVDKYNGDLSKALAAYNAGASTVDQAGGVPDIQETKEYVDAVLKKLALKSDSPKIEMPKAPDPPKPIDR